MKVVSLIVGTINGIDASIKKLDELVGQLGNIRIYNITDTVYPENNYTPVARIVRVVIYD